MIYSTHDFYSYIPCFYSEMNQGDFVNLGFIACTNFREEHRNLRNARSLKTRKIRRLSEFSEDKQSCCWQFNGWSCEDKEAELLLQHNATP